MCGRPAHHAYIPSCASSLSYLFIEKALHRFDRFIEKALHRTLWVRRPRCVCVDICYRGVMVSISRTFGGSVPCLIYFVVFYLVFIESISCYLYPLYSILVLCRWILVSLKLVRATIWGVYAVGCFLLIRDSAFLLHLYYAVSSVYVLKLNRLSNIILRNLIWFFHVIFVFFVKRVASVLSLFIFNLLLFMLISSLRWLQFQTISLVVL